VAPLAGPATPTFAVEIDVRSPAPVMGPRALRTRDRILNTAHEVFLERGYGGTRLQDIARASDLRRTSIYDYFGSKRDLLVALGRAAFARSEPVVQRFELLPDDWCRDDLRSWLRLQLALLDEAGAFSTVWAEAAYDDDELHGQALAAEQRYASRLGAVATRRGASTATDPTHVGLALLGMIRGVWYFQKLRGLPSDDPAVVETLTAMLAAVLDAGAESPR
jgi:AcrR family transcriptional regulator